MPSVRYTPSAVSRLSTDSLAVAPGLVGNRWVPSLATQLRTEDLRMRLCPHTNVRDLAKASGNVQNNDVSAIVGLTWALQGTSSIPEPPRVGKAGARYQNLIGRRNNPAAHTLPCNITLNGRQMTSFVHSKKAKDGVAVILGNVFLGCEKQWDDTVLAALVNRADEEVEDFDAETGSAAAFLESIRATVKECKWSGAGRPAALSEAQLAQWIEYIDKSVWRPKAALAYEMAWARVQGRRAAIDDDAARAENDMIAEIIALKADAVKVLPLSYGHVVKRVTGLVSEEPTGVNESSRKE